MARQGEMVMNMNAMPAVDQIKSFSPDQDDSFSQDDQLHHTQQHRQQSAAEISKGMKQKKKKSHLHRHTSSSMDDNEPTTVHMIPHPAGLIQKVLAEFLGTFFLVFAGCGSIIVDYKNGGDIAHVAIATSFGVAIMIMIYTVGHVSGGHFNPAVTLGFASVGRFPLLQIPVYLLGQCGGSLFASVLLRLIMHDDEMVLGVAVNQPGGGQLQSFVVEVIITCVLMLVISGVATDSRGVGSMAGIAIGSTIALNGVYAGPLSGASMNPARSLGPALVARNFKFLYIYMGGPILGATLGAWMYNALRVIEPSTTKETQTSNGACFSRCFNA